MDSTLSSTPEPESNPPAGSVAVGQFDDVDCTYFLCPDSACQLFTKPNCRVPCEHECPHRAEKLVVCFHCRKPIVLPFDHCSWLRVDCRCGASNFQSMSGRYRRHNLDNPASNPL